MWNESCFVTALIFRGCAEAMYEHDFGCDSDMQVIILNNKKQMSHSLLGGLVLCYRNSNFQNYGII